VIFAFPLISKIICFLETDDKLNSYFGIIGLYNALREIVYLSDANEAELIVEEPEEYVETPEIEEVFEGDVEVNTGLNKALDTYRKLIEKNEGLEPLTEKQQEALEKRIKEIEAREVVETIEEHEPTEIACEKGKITIGPPTLTRFEKARIMGARALQLSLGAPPFIPIPKTARISLDIAMEELEQRVIPITIRRVLPNGDYQNIPIDYFD
jgi:DNA-directed RNA polymerase I, II, and III subunit RPABC2